MKCWSIAFMIILTGVASSMAFPHIAGANGPIGSRLTAEEMGKLLTLHNKARADVGVGPLPGRRIWQCMHSHGLIILPPQAAGWSIVHVPDNGSKSMVRTSLSERWVTMEWWMRYGHGNAKSQCTMVQPSIPLTGTPLVTTRKWYGRIPARLVVQKQSVVAML